MAHTTHAPTPQVPTPSVPPRHHLAHTFLGWWVLAAAIAATGVLLLALTGSDPAQPVPTQAPDSSLLDIPRSADAAERSLAQQEAGGAGVDGWPKGVGRAPDALERRLAQQP